MKARYLLSALAAVLTITAGSCTPKEESDEALLDKIEQATIKYFTDFAEPNTGMARERNEDVHGNIVTTGGTGFGMMAIIAGAERGYYPREEGEQRLEKIISSLERLERFHGAWAHWYDGDSGEAYPFSKYDDGGDLVETAFLTQGILTTRQWTCRESLKARCDSLWRGIEWNWYTQATDSLYWHWSKNYGFKMNHRIRGYDETLITYILAAASPTYPITKECYETSYKTSPYYYNGNEYYGIPLTIGMPYGGPLFFTHYSFLGLDPRGLSDGHTDYFERNRNQCLIHRAYAMDHPEKQLGGDFWGFTSSDDALLGYAGHYPGTPEENGTVSPTAAISSIVYTPEESMAVIRRLFKDPRTWGPYGFYDAVNYTLPEDKQVLEHYLAIDQGPEAVMIENWRSGLLWDLFGSSPEIQAGLDKLGFYYNND